MLQAVVCILLFLSNAFAWSNDSVNLSLVSSWKATPFKINVLETACHRNSSLYLPLVSKLLGIQIEEDEEEEDIDVSIIPDYQISDQEFYSYTLSLFQSDVDISLFNISLSNRVYSPSIESQYRYYRNFIEPLNYCDGQDTFMIQDGNVYCESTDVFALKEVSCSKQNDVLPTDHILGTSKCPLILYGDYRSEDLRKMFAYLYQSMRADKLSFTWRYVPRNSELGNEVLGGYGADLTLKRTDYIVMDDRGLTDEQKKKITFDDSKEVFLTSVEVPKLTSEELKTVDSKLALLILNHTDYSDSQKIDLLTKIVENFPMYSSTIANLEFDDKKVAKISLDSIRDQQIDIPKGLFINNAMVSSMKMDVFQILKILERELHTTDRLDEIGYNASDSRKLLSNFAAYQFSKSKQPYQRYNVADFKDCIVYFNDIEKDPIYDTFMPARQAYASEPQIGRIPSARENIYDILFVFDPMDSEKMYYSLAMIENMLKSKVPVRLGVSFTPNSKIGFAVTEQFWIINETSGPTSALQYLKEISNYLAAGKLTPEALKDFEIPKAPADFDIDAKFERELSFVENFSVGGKAALFVDGIILPFDVSWQSAVRQLSMDVYYMFTQFQRRRIHTNFRNYLMKGSWKKRIPFLVPDNIESIEPDFLSVPDMKEFNFMAQPQSFKSSFVQDKCDEDCNDHSKVPKTITLVGSFGNPKYQKQILNLLEYISHHERIKVNIIDIEDSTEFHNFAKAHDIESALKELKHTTLKSSGEISQQVKQYYQDNLDLILSDKSMYIGINGRYLDLTNHPTITEDQYDMLIKFEERLRLRRLVKLLSKHKQSHIISKKCFTDKYDFLEYATWIVSNAQFKTGEEFLTNALSKYDLSMLNDRLSLSIPSRGENVISVTLVLDPVSENAQKYLALLPLFKSMDFVDIKIYLQPTPELKEMPIKRFYRGNFYPTLQFLDDGSVDITSMFIHFDNMPSRTLFTLSIDEPQSWIVGIKEATTDLDNVKLDITGSISGTYELENIIIEGYATDISTQGGRPIGLPLEILDDNGNRYGDTNVMANFGYFQLKVNPGKWRFDIEPQTKGSSIYSLVGVETSVSKAFTHRYRVNKPTDEYEFYITDLSGATIYPRFSKKQGKENEYLIKVDDGKEEKDKSLFGKWKSQFSNKGTNQAEINIFTIASGHLYERLVEVMIASVMAHTEHTVKFWFIENYSSPQMQQALPILAKHYGFEYEFITYKWPSWLRHQREKQRIIWGYKILFLDVIFPQDLDKVIFVDADQICRTDMKDLVDEDLEGAPYGFTPMCESSKEMEGYRFWKKGYWKKILGDKHKYHISALFVVDLKRFRELAAGDILRSHYQQLATDPKSLSNLDQDLPNNLQDIVKIHSLPQNWLWCETWCSDETLKDARTIDLCNNPLTKEPKLDRAKRQIPEWKDYDGEIEKLLDDDDEDSAPTNKSPIGHDEL